MIQLGWKKLNYKQLEMEKHGMVTPIITVENSKASKVVGLLDMGINMGRTIEEMMDQHINPKSFRIYLEMMKNI